MKLAEFLIDCFATIVMGIRPVDCHQFTNWRIVIVVDLSETHYYY